MTGVLAGRMVLLSVRVGGVAAAGTPSGYVVEIALAGADAKAGTVVVRDGKEIPAKLMMPLFDGDVVFLRDVNSRIGLELGDGRTLELGGGLTRFALDGEIDTGDSTWGILGAIGAVFAGEGEQAPENMAAKGGSLKVPMAVRANRIAVERRSLWLGWQGGTAPYAVVLEKPGGEETLASGIAAEALELALPQSAGERFTLSLRDSAGERVQLRIRRVGRLPDGARTIKGALATAAWLTAQDDGAWTIEAAQMLRTQNTGAAAALLDRIAAGWRLSP